MLAVVIQSQPSAQATYRKGVGDIEVSDQSVYNKLDGMELGVSAALVQDSAEPVAEVIDTMDAPDRAIARPNAFSNYVHNGNDRRGCAAPLAWRCILV